MDDGPVEKKAPQKARKRAAKRRRQEETASADTPPQEQQDEQAHQEEQQRRQWEQNPQRWRHQQHQQWQQYEQGQTEGSENRPAQLLRLAADMYRQHSDLFLQQAAVLERVSADPTHPLSWQIEEPSPEIIQQKLIQEQTSLLAIKGYESMLQVQQRLNYLERLMLRNGVGKTILKRTRPTATADPPLTISTAKDVPTDAFYWFFEEHHVRVAKEMNCPAMESPAEETLVRDHVYKLWEGTNPAQRHSYEAKAAHVLANLPGAVSSSPSVTSIDVGDALEASQDPSSDAPVEGRTDEPEGKRT